MRVRVAPPPASSRSARVSFRGCPLLRSLFAEPASDSSGCPSSSALRLCRRSPLGLPRSSMPSAPLVSTRFWVSPVEPVSPCCAPGTGLGLPLALYLRLYRRWIVESPRSSHLSAVPGVKVPGCPFPSHFRYRRRQYPGRPEHLSSGTGWWDVRVTSDRSPSGSPWLTRRVTPAPLPWRRRSTNFQVALNLCLSPFADSLRLELPRISVPRLTRICFPGLPRFRIHGWVDDLSLAESNFASSACAADESSAPIRYQHSWSGFRRTLNLNL